MPPAQYTSHGSHSVPDFKTCGTVEHLLELRSAVGLITGGPALRRNRAALAAENLALRLQLAVLQVSGRRPRLRKRDRVGCRATSRSRSPCGRAFRFCGTVTAELTPLSTSCMAGMQRSESGTGTAGVLGGLTGEFQIQLLSQKVDGRFGPPMGHCTHARQQRQDSLCRAPNRTLP